MRRPARTWTIFGACAAALAAALGWITEGSLRLERDEARARAEARHQVALSVAMWRIEARLRPVVAAEAWRPSEHYTPFYAPEVAWCNVGGKTRFTKGEVLVSSPLLESIPEWFKLHFQIDAEGRVTSPQVPEPGAAPADIALNAHGRAALGCQESFIASGLAPVLFERGCALSRIEDAAPAEPQSLDPASGAAPAAQVERPEQQLEVDPQAAAGPAGQFKDVLAQSRQEYAQRAISNRAVQSQVFNPNFTPAAEPKAERVRRGSMEGVWLSAAPGAPGELFLIRRVAAGAQEFVQGVWLDWPKLRASLLAETADLLPGADLVPVERPRPEDEGRTLASIPAALDVPAAPAPRVETFSRIRVTLAVTWAAVLAALLAVAWVLNAALDLGERRGRFVSAVTHELRTPLTTFRMYSQMLADGMVPDEAARREYLETLRGESDRLARVVESVLLYARVEQGRGGVRAEEIPASDLVDRVLPVLSQRALAGGMELAVDTDGLGDVRVRADVQVVEQILLNLVDNACKYAAVAHDRRVHLDVRSPGAALEIEVADHGPGIPAEERVEIFEPFHRASVHRAGPVPGAGLGLALARGLARSLGGDVRLAERRQPGAAFLFTLPVTPRRA